MKIIFLDIDGVLNTFGDKELINNIFEKKKLERLINLSNETHSKIIITSDRRIHSDERIVIDDVFDRYNALIDYLSYKILYRNRSDEISYYLNHNQNITNYVILDDNDLGFSQNQELSNHFINTYKNGFSNTEYNLAKDILRGNMIMTKYQLKINNEIEEFNNFKDVLNKARDTILNHMEEETQCYWNYLPFSAGAYMSSLYDDLSITDEEIVIFEKIHLVKERLFYDNDSIFRYIKNNINYNKNEASFSIIKQDDDLILMIKRDNDCLITNMFYMRENHNYYFKSKQEVVVKSPDDFRELGEIVVINVELNCLDVQ